MERQKIVRKLRKLLSVDKATWSADTSEAYDKYIDDLCYVLYYPKSMKYVALFVNDDSSSNDEVSTGNDAARLQAREIRRKSIEDGEEDRVQHAIDVEMRTSVPGKAPPDTKERDKSSKLHNIHASGDDGKKERKRQRSEATDGGGAGGESKDLEIKSVSLSKKTKTNAKTESSASSSATKQKVKKVEVEDEPAATEAASDEAADPFFLEAGADDEGEPSGDAKAAKVPQVKTAIGDLRRLKGDRRGRVAPRVENDGSMTKQELRLLNWQLKVRGKQRAYAPA